MQRKRASHEHSTTNKDNKIETPYLKIDATATFSNGDGDGYQTFTATPEPRGHIVLLVSLVDQPRYQKGHKYMNEVNMNVVGENLAKISVLGSHLGGKYFKTAAKETWTDFDNQKRQAELDESGLQFILNRSPRKFEVRDFDVISQMIKTTPDQTTVVVFNPGTDSEAEAAIVAGETGFGQATDEAITEALRGENRIFANGPKLLAKVNSYNQHEVDRLTALIKVLTSQKDSIISTMKANEKKVQDYEAAVAKSKAAINVAPTDNGKSVSIVVEKA
jgi:hypothetical protein